MPRRYLPLLALLLLALPAPAQDAPQEYLFPDLEGEALREALRDDYTGNTLGYGPARDVLYGEIYDGTLEGIYTGYTITLSPGADPSQDAYQQDINTEHTWPQSQGAGDEPARSDMHHLFPSVVSVNGDRGNLPFGEIPDEQTDRWYYLQDTQSSIPPSSTIDAFSEVDFDDYFEPREVSKGNIARALFYFATIYPSRGGSFFDGQRETLYAWHRADPVDAFEAARNEGIAEAQGNLNPFIVDSTLACRAFFSDAETCAEPVARETPEPVQPLTLQITSAQPASETLRLQVAGDGVPTELFVYDVLGREVVRRTATSGASLTLDVSTWPAGVYLVQARQQEHTTTQAIIVSR